MCLSILSVLGCGRATDETEHRSKVELERQKAEAEFDKALEDLATRYGAIRDWDKVLTKELAFTLELQRALRALDGQPVVVRTALADLAQRDRDRYVATFIFSPWWAVDPANLTYVLATTESDAERLLALDRSSHDHPECAIIARVDSVHKVGLRIDSEIDSRDDESSRVTIEHPDQFIVSGTLIDFIQAPRSTMPHMEPDESGGPVSFGN
jgi:hypothetical protein